MNRGKKVFLILAAVFFGLLFYASYDFAKKTTFPGKRSAGDSTENAIMLKSDSLFEDSAAFRPEN